MISNQKIKPTKLLAGDLKRKPKEWRAMVNELQRSVREKDGVIKDAMMRERKQSAMMAAVGNNAAVLQRKLDVALSEVSQAKQAIERAIVDRDTMQEHRGELHDKLILCRRERDAQRDAFLDTIAVIVHNDFDGCGTT